MNNKFLNFIATGLFLSLFCTGPLMASEGAGGDHSGHGMHGSDENEWIVPAEDAAIPNPIKATPESIATGDRLFKHFCITCHGYKADGKGLSGTQLNPKPANLTQMAGHHTDGDLAYKIKNGRGPMPHWLPIISDTNVWHVVNYIQSLKPIADENTGSKPRMEGHDHAIHKH